MRPLERAIQHNVQDRLAEVKLADALVDVGKLLIDLATGEIAIKGKKRTRALTVLGGA